MRVHVLVLDHVFDLGLAAVLDAFQTANELNAMAGLYATRFDVRVVGVRRSVRTAQGFRVPVRDAGRHAPDCVLVPAIGYSCRSRWKLRWRGRTSPRPRRCCVSGRAAERP